MEISTTSPTITSLDISEMVESLHADVKRSIARLVTQGVIVQPPTADIPFVDAMGRQRTQKVSLFTEANKRDSYVVVAQLSPVFTARLVDRWQELEAAQKTQAIVRQQAPVALPEAFERLLERKLKMRSELAAIYSQKRSEYELVLQELARLSRDKTRLSFEAAELESELEPLDIEIETALSFVEKERKCLIDQASATLADRINKKFPSMKKVPSLAPVAG